MSLGGSKNPCDVIIAPVVSEKSYAHMDRGRHMFIVVPGSNKTEIKQTAGAISDVRVLSVSTINRKGKTHRTRIGTGKSKNTRHAIVTLRKGTIDIFGDVA